jgi:hypothetical protein
MGHISVRFYFGSARTKPEDLLLAEKIAYKISKAGWSYRRRQALWAKQRHILAVELQWD